jgi:predicted NUDIX family NTP pyrophosphohydrolase
LVCCVSPLGSRAEGSARPPGGPFWRKKDRNSGSIPKGEYGDDETAEVAAVREFEEETGFRPTGALLPLGDAVQAGGKRVTAVKGQSVFLDRLEQILRPMPSI